ncbi:hypothetical protein [Calothrix sp. NIES-2098]|uniref:hypothetical protein n=1 Tax=Calothrix sp. NIES-2098 TaxID=1954171 RepID=UPI000B61815E|nr:hypothetical protein NIES2098_41910 [Calothrix sp. NIES-2098]
MPEAVRAIVDEYLLSGMEYKHIAKYAEGEGFNISPANLSTHRHKHLEAAIANKRAMVHEAEGDPELLPMKEYFKKLMAFTQHLTLAQAVFISNQQKSYISGGRGAVLLRDVEVFEKLANLSLNLKASVRFDRIEEEAKRENLARLLDETLADLAAVNPNHHIEQA